MHGNGVRYNNSLDVFAYLSTRSVAYRFTIILRRFVCLYYGRFNTQLDTIHLDIHISVICIFVYRFGYVRVVVHYDGWTHGWVLFA